jgi:hypothetical protein
MQNMINLLTFGTRKHLYQKSESLHLDGHKNPALLHFDIRKPLLQECKESVQNFLVILLHVDLSPKQKMNSEVLPRKSDDFLNCASVTCF